MPLNPKTKYKKMNAGEGTPISAGITLKFACCDCALVHTIQFFKTKEGLDMAHWRDNRATAQLRRVNYGNLQQSDKKYCLVRINS